MNNRTEGIGFCGALAIVFIALKLLKVINMVVGMGSVSDMDSCCDCNRSLYCNYCNR